MWASGQTRDAILDRLAGTWNKTAAQNADSYAAALLMIHHDDLPLSGECPSCRGSGTTRLCAHMAAIGLAFLGDDQELTRRLAAVSHAELVTLITDLADHIPQARESIWSRLA